jgi:hypothetical protein
MLSRRQTVVIALFACLVVGLAWQDRTSWEHSHQQEHQEGAPEKPGKKAVYVIQAEDANDRIARYTFWLAVLTGCLVGVAGFQGYFLLRADKTARISANAAIEAANAAKRNADALISSERAHLYVIVDRSNLYDSIEFVSHVNLASKDGSGTWDDDATITTRPIVSFFFKNLGKTAAVVTEIGYQLIQGVENQRIFDYEMALATLLRPVVDGSAETDTVDCGLKDSVFRVRDARAAMDGSRPLYFYGYIAYVDSFNRQHTYFWRHQNLGATFVMVHSEERTEDSA